MYPNLDPTKHPRMCVIFNNVSKNNYPEKLFPEYGETGVAKTSETEVSFDKYIHEYRNLLIDALDKQYKTIDK